MLELDHITQHYAGRPLALEVSLRVAPGQTVALLGASGSGKSTLLKIAAGLQTPEAGRVLWAGQDLAAVPPERRGVILIDPPYEVKSEAEKAVRMMIDGLHRFAQRAQEKLPLQRIAVSGRAVQVVAHYRKLHVISWCHRDLIGGEIERHPLRHKIFDVEIPHP